MTQTTQPSRPFGLLHVVLFPAYLLERSSGRQRFFLLLLYVLIAIPILLLGWREARLMEIPRVGDPFDVRKYTAREVADERNAFVFYRRASEKMKALQPTSAGLASASATPRPATPRTNRAQPDMSQWLDDNREALELWLIATQCPDALDVKPADLRIDTQMTILQQLREFARLAKLEADRLEAEGDMAGAYRMHQGTLRSSRHATLSGPLIAHLVGVNLHGQAAGAIENWADDARTSTSLLRTALEDAKAFQRTWVPNSFSFQQEYVTAMNLMNDPKEAAKLEDEALRGDQQLADFLPMGAKGTRWLLHEPERSRRLYRLWATNWLAYCDLPRDERPGQTGTAALSQFKPGQHPPRDAHLMPPEELERQVRKAPLARQILPAVSQCLNAMDRERLRHDGLVVTLAELLYRREKGSPPKTLGDLVGTYLDELPPEFGPMDPPLTVVPTSETQP